MKEALRFIASIHFIHSLPLYSFTKINMLIKTNRQETNSHDNENTITKTIHHIPKKKKCYQEFINKKLKKILFILMVPK